MNWDKANRQQLVEIAFFDAGARLEHRVAAAAELKRRNRTLPKGRTQYKITEVPAR